MPARYPRHDTTSGSDAIAQLRNANVPGPLIARMKRSTRPLYSVLDLTIGKEPPCSPRVPRSAMFSNSLAPVAGPMAAVILPHLDPAAIFPDSLEWR